MPKHHTFLNRDDNEKELVKLWVQLGCIWIQQPRENGFDGILICPHTGIHLIEIKNGAKRWTLTDRERARCQEITLANGTYSIVTNEQEALELIGQ